MVRFRETLQSDYIPESCTAWLTCAIAFFLDTQYFHLGIKPHWKNKKLENKNTMPCSCKISQRMVFDKLFLAEEIDKIMDMKIKNWTRLIKNSKLCSYCRFNNTEVNGYCGFIFYFFNIKCITNYLYDWTSIYSSTHCFQVSVEIENDRAYNSSPISFCRNGNIYASRYVILSFRRSCTRLTRRIPAFFKSNWYSRGTLINIEISDTDWKSTPPYAVTERDVY